MSESENMKLALLMIKEVQDALKRGTKHYNKKGVLLETPEAILSCLKEEGEVTFKSRNQQ